MNMQNSNLDTALHKAAEEGHLECLKLLIEAGADATLKNSDGKTALDNAVYQCKNECAEYLKPVIALNYSCVKINVHSNNCVLSTAYYTVIQILMLKELQFSKTLYVSIIRRN